MQHWPTLHSSEMNSSEVNSSNKRDESQNSNTPFLQQDGFVFAAKQLVFDCWNASNLDDLKLVEQALRDSAKALKVELLHIHLHNFKPDGRVSGIAIMPNLQIGIKTWPEMRYAALDFFICGPADPSDALSVFKRAFLIGKVDVNEHFRGRQVADMTPASID